MKLLSEINQMSNLSETQKAVLAITATSATPRQAYESTTGSDKLVYARDSLVRMGLLQLNNGQLLMTNAGQEAAVQYNVVDQSGQPTEEAEQLLQTVHQDPTQTDQEGPEGV